MHQQPHQQPHMHLRRHPLRSTSCSSPLDPTMGSCWGASLPVPSRRSPVPAGPGHLGARSPPLRLTDQALPPSGAAHPTQRRLSLPEPISAPTNTNCSSSLAHPSSSSQDAHWREMCYRWPTLFAWATCPGSARLCTRSRDPESWARAPASRSSSEADSEPPPCQAGVWRAGGGRNRKTRR